MTQKQNVKESVTISLRLKHKLHSIIQDTGAWPNE